MTGLTKITSSQEKNSLISGTQIYIKPSCIYDTLYKMGVKGPELQVIHTTET